MNHRRLFSQIALVTGTLLFSVGLQTFAAFTPPTTTPPAADAYAPLNTSPTAQAKTGGLLLNTGGATNGLIVQSGSVGIGTVAPKRQFVISHPTAPLIGLETSSNGLGWFMYADAGSPSGFHIGNYTDSTWTSPANYPFNVTSAGNVGIGTTNPQAALDVNGGIAVRGSQLYKCPQYAANVAWPNAGCNVTCVGQISTYNWCYFSGANICNRVDSCSAL